MRLKPDKGKFGDTLVLVFCVAILVGIVLLMLSIFIAIFMLAPIGMSIVIGVCLVLVLIAYILSFHFD